MAQIVTITNPLTGQPAQVDQLEHTAQEIDDSIGRALPGGEIDTLLAGKAPAGYGLGTTPKQITDWNAANVCGWYNCDSGAANSPDSSFGWFGLTYTAGNPEIFVQDAFALVNVDKYYHRRRMYYPGTGNGTPWEWVDPPLYEGVEYRTTERYQGKPVYKQLIDFGALPNSSAKEVSVPNVNVMRNISIDLSKSVCTKTGFLTTNLFPRHPNISVIYFNAGTVRIETIADYSSWSAQICISYTKSTD